MPLLITFQGNWQLITQLSHGGLLGMYTDCMVILSSEMTSFSQLECPKGATAKNSFFWLPLNKLWGKNCSSFSHPHSSFAHSTGQLLSTAVLLFMHPGFLRQLEEWPMSYVRLELGGGWVHFPTNQDSSMQNTCLARLSQQLVTSVQMWAGTSCSCWLYQLHPKHWSVEEGEHIRNLWPPLSGVSTSADWHYKYSGLTCIQSSSHIYKMHKRHY